MMRRLIILFAMAAPVALPAGPTWAQAGGDSPDRYVDSYGLPGVRRNPRPPRVDRCMQKWERLGGRDGVDRWEEVMVCEDNGITIRSMGPGDSMSPYGAPVGGYRGLGGAGTR
jgi:hypothetical protein